MSNEFEINAELRTDLGKGSSRRLRRLENKVPAVVYGTDKEPESISILAKELDKSLMNEAFYSHILTLNLDGKSQQVVLKNLQRHPA
ncbi:MAG: 50S ribosomal protein L25, partial [Gammaproteobacteria bacterium]|nr:50S ribosomal protein L25 [Gammaproteobacteria bacterium]